MPDCQATYHVYNNPPKDDSLCDKDGTLLIQREDDKETAVARRLAEYDERTAPLIEYYRGRVALLHASTATARRTSSSASCSRIVRGGAA